MAWHGDWQGRGTLMCAWVWPLRSSLPLESSYKYPPLEIHRTRRSLFHPTSLFEIQALTVWLSSDYMSRIILLTNPQAGLHVS